MMDDLLCWYFSLQLGEGEKQQEKKIQSFIFFKASACQKQLNHHIIIHYLYNTSGCANQWLLCIFLSCCHHSWRLCCFCVILSLPMYCMSLCCRRWHVVGESDWMCDITAAKILGPKKYTLQSFCWLVISTSFARLKKCVAADENGWLVVDPPPVLST